MSRKPTPEDEATLIQRAQGGDRKACDELLRRYQPLVWSNCHKILGKPEDADDATNTTLLCVWKKIGTFDPKKGKFVTWLGQVTHNRAIDLMRHRCRRTKLDEEFSVDPLFGGRELAYEVDHDEDDRRNRLLMIMNHELTDQQLECFVPHYFTHEPHSSIAKRLNEPLGTVKARIRRGFMALQKVVRNDPAFAA